MTDDTCINCGRTRRPGTGSKTKQLCSTCYSYWYRANRTRTKTCAGCGQQFETARTEIRYCTPECHNHSQERGGRRVRARDRRQRHGQKGSVRWRALRRAAKAAEGSSGKGLIWVQGNCILCGSPFTSPGQDSRYCSRACRQIDRNSRMYGLKYADRLTIYDRDNWTCQICAEPVDPNAEPRSDWYPTLDHVIPRSRGGTNDLTNLRTAHHWCNSVRGDLSHYTDADLAA